jgi:hydrogenase maturation protein HypF
MMLDGERPVMLRRARGFAPLPINLTREAPPILATGAELKNTFCLTKDDNAFISQHIGDLENVETLLHYERTEMLYEHIFATQPSVFVCDSHPGYLSTTYCHERNEAPLTVQHHKAHIASCLTENGHTGDVVGVACDGTGFGEDGLIWGGEFFVGGLKSGFERAAHLEYFPLLGGEAAIHAPWRTALAAVWKFAPDAIDFCCRRFGISEKKKRLLLRQLETNLNCPDTSSCGRLFDAVAAMALNRTEVSFEAQAAMELESMAMASTRSLSGTENISELDELAYRFSLNTKSQPWTLSPARALNRLIKDIENEVAPETIAALFHLGLSEAIVRTSLKLAESHEVDSVALSGGVFQNRLLLQLVQRGLEEREIKVFTHSLVPPNDGGISLGQAALAAYYNDDARHRNGPDDDI